MSRRFESWSAEDLGERLWRIQEGVDWSAQDDVDGGEVIAEARARLNPWGHDDPQWLRMVKLAEDALTMAVLWSPAEQVFPINKAIAWARRAIPHDFVEGRPPDDGECAWCFAGRDGHGVFPTLPGQ